VSDRRVRRVCAGIALASVAVASVRVASTWRVFTETNDEAFHLGVGLQWLGAGAYTFEVKHPPVARIAVAIGPYLLGSGFHNATDAGREGRAALNGNPDYFSVLSEARAGALPFLWLACLAIWLLARHHFGVVAAAASVTTFTMVPVVLGHAGVATTDMALTGSLAMAFWSWQSWLDRPGRVAAARTGFLTAFSVLCKFSSVVFLPAMLLAAGLANLSSSQAALRRLRSKAGVAELSCALAAAFLTLWAIYRFEVAPLRTPADASFPLLEHYLGASGPAINIAYRVLATPVPLPSLWNGLYETYQHNAGGHMAYLFGRVRSHGWWYFFPVVLAVKTPLALFCLAGLGLWVAARRGLRGGVSMAVAGAAIVLVSMTSNINIGVRHILPVYCFLAVLAGVATVELWASRRLVVLALWGWLILGSALAHPDYLADFNALAGPKPERIVADSDIDWGQDLHRATTWLIAHDVRDSWLRYAGAFPPSRETRVRYRRLRSGEPVTGWVTISVRSIRFGAAMARAGHQPEPYAWLRRFQPVARVGSSILIYHVDE
jgi:hypothetical protein